MQVIAMMQVYREGLFIERALEWIYPLVDRIIVTEGLLTCHGDFSVRSDDGTCEKIMNFKSSRDPQNKIFVHNTYKSPDGHHISREAYEGHNKNWMLKRIKPENGDLLFIHDADEFWKRDNFLRVVDKFRNNDQLRSMVFEEWQFAYGLKYCCLASHGGRFMRYVDGARFKGTNHLTYPDGTDISKKHDGIVPREDTQFYHLCNSKHPLDIRQKVLSFGRPSFTNWYNNCYLTWPVNPDVAYENNTRLSRPMGWPGGGYLEGQTHKLFEFEGELPEVLQDLDLNWIDYIKEHRRGLVI